MIQRINTDDIDESFIIASVKKDPSKVPENAAQLLSPLPASRQEELRQASQGTHECPEPVKEESKRKKGSRQDYEALFIKESNVTARLGKTIYIRREYHERILKIIQVIGGNEVSLFSYIDNVLAHHFETFQEDITQSYKQNNKDSIF